MGKIGCVAIVKNEARHIAEWLAWQFIVGFDTVILLDNGSTDATIAIAQDFAPARDVRVVGWPSTAPDYQMRGYEHIARAMAEEFEWLGFFDADEFLRLDDGLTLKGLLAARPEAAVALPWVIFGSNGHDEFPDGLLVETFTRRAEPQFGPNHHVKSIIRPALMESCLNPHAFAMRGDYVDLLGRSIVWGGGPGVLAATPDHRGGSLNHYFVRSRAHWREKMARGYHDLTRPEGEFEAYDRNEVPDERLAARAGEIRRALAGPLPLLRREGLEARDAAALCEATDAAGFLARRCSSYTPLPAATIALPAVDCYGPGAAALKFRGPTYPPFSQDQHRGQFPARSTAPDITLSRLSYVLYIPKQVAIAAPTPQERPPVSLQAYSVVLRSSFNAPHGHQFHHDLRQHEGDLFSLTHEHPPAVRQAGSYLLLDSQHRGDFGHTLCDVLGMAWAYESLRALGREDVAVLVHDRADKVLAELLEAAGIARERLVSFDHPVLLDELILPGKAFQIQGYVNDAALATYRTIRDAMAGTARIPALPERLYLSRQTNPARRLLNEDDVAKLFMARGFVVVAPETLPLRQQIALAANARMIAGPAGSNMFQLAFQRDLEKAFVLGSNEFVQTTELFMCGGRPVRFGYFVGEVAEQAGPHSAWRVDLEALASAVDAWLAAPPGELGRAAEDVTLFVGARQFGEVAQALAQTGKIVVVEPEARLYYALSEEFAAEIAEGRLVVENFAPAPRGGEIAMLTPADGGRAYPVATISWEELVAKHGNPSRVYLGGEVPGFGPAPR